MNLNFLFIHYRLKGVLIMLLNCRLSFVYMFVYMLSMCVFMRMSMIYEWLCIRKHELPVDICVHLCVFCLFINAFMLLNVCAYLYVYLIDCHCLRVYIGVVVCLCYLAFLYIRLCIFQWIHRQLFVFFVS